MGRLALQVGRKPTLRLALDHFFPGDFYLKKPTKLKDLFCIQGLVVAFFVQTSPNIVQMPEKATPLGLFPFPQKQGNILLINPSLLLNWPKTQNDGLYFAAYCTPTAVYTDNPNDPAPLFLKQFGYGYGDNLTNETHPLLVR